MVCWRGYNNKLTVMCFEDSLLQNFLIPVLPMVLNRYLFNENIAIYKGTCIFYKLEDDVDLFYD